jgi:sporulation protein YabP
MISEQNYNINNTEKIQNVILENRKKLSISGVADVLSFDDQIVILDTNLGMLTVKGKDIRITKLSLDTTDVIIEGEIGSLVYSEKKEMPDSKTLLGKIFR